MADEDLDLDAELAKLGELSAAADAALAEDGPSAVVPVTRDAMQIRVDLAQRRSALERTRQAVTAQAQRVKDALEQQQAAIEAQVREMNAVIAPLKEQVALAEEGMWSMDLYLGRDEGYEILREGDPAPADTPIVLRQQTLYMDEECRLKAEDGGIDIDDLGAFDRWVLEDPANLEQLLPEIKGVVALQVRRHPKNYESPFEALKKMGTDQWTYWLIRNGQKVFRMFTNFDVGPTMIPRREEFTSFFQGTRGGYFGEPVETFPLEPGTEEWEKAEKAADARKRHFMRAALVLQGLLDRTTVLHPLPAPRLSFLEPDGYDAGHVVVITDADSIGSGRKPYDEWMKELKAAVVPGMRIVFRETYEVREGRERSGRLHPRYAASPKSGVYVIDRLDGGYLIFKYDRPETRHGYERPNDRWDQGEWGEWPYQQKASCMLSRHDDFWMPFDGVDVETLRDYMGARSERHAYMELFPLMKAAIAAKEAEEAEEVPVRLMLVGELLKAGADQEEAEAAVGELVAWWKTQNKYHRALLDEDQAVMGRAVKAIVREFGARRAAVVDQAAEEAVVSDLRARFPELLYVGRRNDGRYVAYAAEPQVPYVVAIEISKTARSAKEVRWSSVQTGWRHWRELWSSEAWAEWKHDRRTKDFLSGPELEAAVAEIRAHYAEPQEAEERGWGSKSVQVQLAAVEDDSYYGEWSPRRSLQAIFRQVPVPMPNLDRLLTEPPAEPETYGVKVRWERKSSAVKLHLNPAEAGWISWGGFRVSGTTVLWQDEAIIEQLGAAAAAREAAEPHRQRLEEISSAAQSSIRRQWLGLAERALYDRFIEDYMDPFLWEGHRKTVKDPVYPRDLDNAVERVLELAVERGLVVDGLTLTEVRDQVKALGVKVKKVPAEVADLVVGAEPEPLPVSS